MFRTGYRFDVKSFISTLPSLSTAFLDLIPGSLLVLIGPLFVRYPFLLLIYPQLLSFRGSISGIVVGRYATSLHLGVVKPSLRNNTTMYYTLLFNSFILIIVGSFVVSIFSMLWLYLLYHIIHFSFIFLFSFIVSIVFLSALVSLPINLLIGSSSFLKGLDPDIIAYPFASTIGDIAITVFFILYTLITFSYNLQILLEIGVILSLLAPFILYRKIDKKLFRKEFSESILSIILVSFLVGITGNLFRKIERFLNSHPLLYVIYPSFLTLSGDSASIIGSKASTRLALGTMEDYLKSFYIEEISIVELGGSIVLTGMIAYSSLVTNTFSVLSGVVFIAGLISILLISLFSLFTAYLTYYRGLDPDHFINPFSSVMADMIATLILALITLIL